MKIDLYDTQYEVSELWPSFLHFVCERQRVFWRRYRGEEAPWSENPLMGHKYTNVYRVLDRGTQHLLRSAVLASEDLAPIDQMFRAFVYRVFNNMDTWDEMEENLLISVDGFDRDEWIACLDGRANNGRSLFTGAYQIAAPSGEEPFHIRWIDVFDNILKDGQFAWCAQAESLAEMTARLDNLPGVGTFMAHQIAVDMNYVKGFDENNTGPVGPGAYSGFRLLMSEYQQQGAQMCEFTAAWALHWEALTEGYNWCPIPGRDLTAVDIEHALCEFSKYARHAADPAKYNLHAFNPREDGLKAFIFPESWEVPELAVPDDLASPAGALSVHRRLGKPATKHRGIDTVELAGKRLWVTEFFDAFLDYVCERQSMFWRWQRGNPAPYTENPLLAAYDYSNAYRANNGWAQFTISEIIFNPSEDQDPLVTIFRVLMWNIFKRHETWTRWATRKPAPDSGIAQIIIDNIEQDYAEGHAVFNTRFRMPLPPKVEGEPEPRQFHTAWAYTLENLAVDTPALERINAATTLEGIYAAVLLVPGYGPFLAYQAALDINYYKGFPEDFVVLEPRLGSSRALDLMVKDFAGMSKIDVVHAITDNWDVLIGDRHFDDLFGRPLSAVDIEDNLCEFEQMTALASGARRGVRITESRDDRTLGYPPAWELPFAAANPRQPGPKELGEPGPDDASVLPWAHDEPRPMTAQELALEAQHELAVRIVPIRSAVHSGKIAKPPVRGYEWRDEERTPTPEEWASADMYGIILDGLTVCDFDSREALERFAPLIEACDTMAVRSIKGMHVYFLGETRAFSGPGFDVKSGPGHYVVGPGSTPAAAPGRTYRLLGNWNVLPAPAPPARDLLTALMAASVEGRPDVASLEGGVRELGSGARNSGLASLAGSMQRAGFDDDAIKAALHRHNSAHCKPPLPEAEVNGILDSILKYEKGDGSPAGAPVAGSCRVCHRPSLKCPGCGQMHTDRRDWSELLQPVPAEDLKDLPPPGWAVEPLWPDDGVSILYGPTGSFKTYIALDWALRAAAGQGLLSPTLEQAGRTLYLAGEGKRTLWPRLQSSLLAHWYTRIDFICEALPLLGDLEAEKALEATIIDGGYTSMVLDTLQTFKSGAFEEDSADKMAELFKSVQGLGVPVLLVMHAGKDQTRGPRGSSAFMTDSSAVWRCARTNDTVKLTCEKMRQAEPQDWEARLGHHHGIEDNIGVTGYHIAPTVDDTDAIDMVADAVATLDPGSTYTNNELVQILGDSYGPQPGRQLETRGVMEKAPKTGRHTEYRLVVGR